MHAIFKKEIHIFMAIIFCMLLTGAYVVFAQEPDEDTSGLVGEWNGDAVSGRTATDVIGGNDGTIVGGVSVVSGETGKIFRFDGTSGYITMGNPKDLNFGTEPFAIEADFNWDGGGKSSALNIVRKSNYPANGPGSGYWLRISRENKTIEFSVGATTGPEGQSLITAPLAPGAWHHVTATKDYSDAVKLYVDGKSKGTVLREAKNTNSSSEAPFTLGAWNDRFGATEFFPGKIEVISVYEHPLFDEYPVSELGNCNNKSECRTYCEDTDHFRECIDFVKKNHLASPEEIAKWEEFIDVAAGGGPGGCKNEKQCIAYCEDASHIVECTEFVAKHNLVSPEDLADMQKISKAVKAGAKLPGNCHNKAECISYCDDLTHTEECVVFAEKAGFMSKEDAEFVRRAGGKSPGDCARGSKTPEDGKRACSAFCAKSENQQTCMDFAVQVGMLTAEEAKELGGGGSLEDFNACLPYINKEALACFDALGKDLFEQLKAGDVPQDIDTIKDMVKKMKTVRVCLNKNTDEEFSKLPPGGLMCLEKEFGENPVEKIKSGKLSCRQFAGAEERIKACFMETMQKQIDECLSLSCSDVASCFQKLGTGGRGDKSSDQSQLTPEVEKRLKDRLNSCTGEQIKECLTKDCSEVQSCINKLSGEGGGEEQKGESQLDPAIESEIQAKISGCFQKQGGQQGGQQGGGGGLDAGECDRQGGVWKGQQCDFSKKGAVDFGAPQSGGQGLQGRSCPVLTPRACPAGQNARQYKDAQGCDAQTECFPEAPSDGTMPSPGGSSYEIPITPEICANFTNIPACSYVGSPDSQNYKLCKQCFPNK